MCWLQQQSIYGLRDAGQSFELFVRSTEETLGFHEVLFYHKERRIQAYVDGDNSVTRGSRTEVQWFHEALSEHTWAKVEGSLGPDPSRGDSLGVTCLDRFFQVRSCQAAEPKRIDIDADAPHVSSCLQSTSLSTLGAPFQRRGRWKTFGPGAGSTLKQHGWWSAMPEPFSCKEIARFMAEPCELEAKKLKRLCRYLLGVPRPAQRIETQQVPKFLDGLSHHHMILFASAKDQSHKSSDEREYLRKPLDRLGKTAAHACLGRCDRCKRHLSAVRCWTCAPHRSWNPVAPEHDPRKNWSLGAYLEKTTRVTSARSTWRRK